MVEPTYLDRWKQERRALPLSITNETRVHMERKKGLINGTLPVEQIVEGFAFLHRKDQELARRLRQLTFFTLANSLLFILLLIKESL